MERWMDGRINGRMDGWIERWKEGRRREEERGRKIACEMSAIVR